MMKIASLPMYDFPELAAATHDFWRGLRAHMRDCGLSDIPERLSVPGNLDSHWRRADLIFSQTCGYPLTHDLAGLLQPIATPGYDAPGCDGPFYSSVFLARAGDRGLTLSDFRGRCIAYNAADSQSGYRVLAYELARLGLGWRDFQAILESGSHRRSMAWVAEGRADFCAIDCVSWALLGDIAPAECKALTVIGRSAPAPALPFVTAQATDADSLAKLRLALRRAIADPALAATRRALRLATLHELNLAAYDAILDQERAAASALAA